MDRHEEKWLRMEKEISELKQLVKSDLRQILELLQAQVRKQIFVMVDRLGSVEKNMLGFDS